MNIKPIRKMNTLNNDIPQLRSKYTSFRKIEHDFRESARHFLSRMLMDTDEDNPMQCSIVLESTAPMMSSLDALEITSMWQEPQEGVIWVQFYGFGSPLELDDIRSEELIEIIEYFDNENSSH